MRLSMESDQIDPVPTTMAFVVRIAVNDTPEVRGTIERVRTREKRRFESLEALSRLLLDMAQPEAHDD